MHYMRGKSRSDAVGGAPARASVRAKPLTYRHPPDYLVRVLLFRWFWCLRCFVVVVVVTVAASFMGELLRWRARASADIRQGVQIFAHRGRKACGGANGDIFSTADTDAQRSGMCTFRVAFVFVLRVGCDTQTGVDAGGHRGVDAKLGSRVSNGRRRPSRSRGRCGRARAAQNVGRFGWPASTLDLHIRVVYMCSFVSSVRMCVYVHCCIYGTVDYGDALVGG